MKSPTEKALSRRTYRVRCQSGLMGWRSRLHVQYNSPEEFEGFCRMYRNHRRLGYRSPAAAWRANPVIEGSTNPSDYRKVRD